MRAEAGAVYGLPDGGTPNSDGPGNAAWQQAKAAHAAVMQAEMRARRN